MQTVRGAAALLGAAGPMAGLTSLARAIGMDGDATPVDRALRDTLGIAPLVDDASVVAGPGALRALALTVPHGTVLRDALVRVAGRVATRAPHVLWVFVAAESSGDGVAVAVPVAGRTPQRIAALIASRSRILDSDAETVRSLAAARTPDDLATHLRFADVLGRDVLSRRFFRTLDACVGDLAGSARVGSANDRHEVALLYASRLLFLGFLQAKGWLDGDHAFVERRFDACMAGGGEFHRRVLLPLFFGTLNTPVSRRAAAARAFGRIPFLNGGLFTPTSTERRYRRLRFGDEALGRFVGDLLSRYRFTAREETSSFEEAAIDPEMLGRTFECLMAAQSRRTSGAFYTPQSLVIRVAGAGLESALGSRVGAEVAGRWLSGEALRPRERGAALDALRTLRVLDPACGSGAFLVHLLDRLSSLAAAAGDTRDPDVVRRDVLSRSIFGVDVNPTAVWLCQLRLWLGIVIDTADPTGSDTPPLPNLDRTVRIGDALAGEAFAASPIPGGAALRRLRERYARASGFRKATLARALDREERRLVLAATASELEGVSADRRELLALRRGRDLFGDRYRPTHDEARRGDELRDRSVVLRRRVRDVSRGAPLPLSFRAHFADVGAAGGFSLIVGNPPWVRPHRVDAESREAMRRDFIVARSAPWAAGADAAGAGRGFSAQVDLAALFVERSLRLIAPGAALSLLVPAKLWRSLAGGGLRRLLTDDAQIDRVEDYSDMPAAFDAAVYPALVVARRRLPDGSLDNRERTQVTVMHRGRVPASWSAAPGALGWDDSPGAPWLLLPPRVRRGFEALREAGIPLAESAFGRPLLGVKCGLNDAFVVAVRDRTANIATIASVNGRAAEIDASHLRPVIRGERVRPWTVDPGDAAIVWPYDAAGVIRPTLPPDLERWLAPHRRDLLGRADARAAARWWSLFRTEGARHDVPRVVWADIGRTPRAAVLDAGDPAIPLNSCYVARCPTRVDALALAALLNSPLVAAWLAALAEPARGGYRRYLGWTMALLPTPSRWARERTALAGLGRRAVESGRVPSSADLLDATVAAFGVTLADVEPLLAWSAP